MLVGLSVVHFLSDGMVCIADPHGPFVTASACRLLTAAVAGTDKISDSITPDWPD